VYGTEERIVALRRRMDALEAHARYQPIEQAA
jgi:hypothetical protein